MKCCKCPFYESGVNWNHCKVIGTEYFRTQDDCDFVLENGEIDQSAIDKAFGGNM